MHHTWALLPGETAILAVLLPPLGLVPRSWRLSCHTLPTVTGLCCTCQALLTCRCIPSLMSSKCSWPPNALYISVNWFVVEIFYQLLSWVFSLRHSLTVRISGESLLRLPQFLIAQSWEHCTTERHGFGVRVPLETCAQTEPQCVHFQNGEIMHLSVLELMWCLCWWTLVLLFAFSFLVKCGGVFLCSDNIIVLRL